MNPKGMIILALKTNPSTPTANENINKVKAAQF